MYEFLKYRLGLDFHTYFFRVIKEQLLCLLCLLQSLSLLIFCACLTYLLAATKIHLYLVLWRVFSMINYAILQKEGQNTVMSLACSHINKLL